jgi:hypothetical protein
MRLQKMQDFDKYQMSDSRPMAKNMPSNWEGGHGLE